MTVPRRRQDDVLRYEFPYMRMHGRSYPLIPIALRRGKYAVKTFALLDSGASISVFRPEIARALHIRKKGHASIRLGTANGGVDIAVTDVNVKIGRTAFPAKIGFSDAHAVSFNIVGRESFFHRFSICFNEIMTTVVMVPLKGLRK